MHRRSNWKRRNALCERPLSPTLAGVLLNRRRPMVQLFIRRPAMPPLSPPRTAHSAVLFVALVKVSPRLLNLELFHPFDFVTRWVTCQLPHLRDESELWPWYWNNELLNWAGPCFTTVSGGECRSASAPYDRHLTVSIFVSEMDGQCAESSVSHRHFQRGNGSKFSKSESDCSDWFLSVKIFLPALTFCIVFVEWSATLRFITDIIYCRAHILSPILFDKIVFRHLAVLISNLRRFGQNIQHHHPATFTERWKIPLRPRRSKQANSTFYD